MSAICTEYIIPLFILSSMDPAREVPAPPSARGVRTCLAHDFTSERPYMFRPRHRMPSPHPLPQCAQPPFRMRPPFHAPSPLRARRRRPGAASRTCSRTPPRSAAPPQDEISLRNNLFRRLYRILLETRRAAWRGGFGNRGPPRGVMRSDAMNLGEPRGVRTDVPRRGRREYFARRHAAYRPGDAPAPSPPPHFFSLTPTCRRSSPAGAGG